MQVPESLSRLCLLLGFTATLSRNLRGGLRRTTKTLEPLVYEPGRSDVSKNNMYGRYQIYRHFLIDIMTLCCLNAGTSGLNRSWVIIICLCDTPI
jgi:superfamily II DNA or RNA helicase